VSGYIREGGDALPGSDLSADASGRRVADLRVVRLALASLLAAAAAVIPAASAGDGSVLRGVSQHGAWLGKPSAPVVLVEYVDLQCPYCAEFSRRTLPPLIREYVRTGKVRILFRGMAFLGPDSVKALRWTFGAAAQNRLWNVLELLFHRQGRENSGWVTSRLLTEVARAVPGLDLARLRRDAKHTDFQVAAAAAAAKAANVPGTPYFQVGRSLSSLEPLRLETFDSDDISARLDKLLR
jgi:protein-disulfide isomerase